MLLVVYHNNSTYMYIDLACILYDESPLFSLTKDFFEIILILFVVILP